MNHKTTAAIGVFPSKIVGLRVLTTPSDADPAAQVTHLIAVPVERSSDISLTIAEVLAGLGAPGPWDQLASVARFDNAVTGPVSGAVAHAQTLADERLQSMRWATTPHCGTIVPAADIDDVVAIIEGTGNAIDHIEHLDAALLTATRGNKHKNRLPGVSMPSEIIDSSAVTQIELGALVGAALAASSPAVAKLSTSSSLLESVGQTCEPAQSKGGLGWAVAPMPAPVDFATAVDDDPAEFTLLIAALAIAVVALALTVAVV